MTVTKEQAIKGGVFHYTPAESLTNSRGKVKVERWRSNGQCKVWKTRPDEFQLPIKFGLRGYSYLTELNAHEFHREEDCPNGL